MLSITAKCRQLCTAELSIEEDCELIKRYQTELKDTRKLIQL